jgi:hypothetical protein
MARRDHCVEFCIEQFGIELELLLVSMSKGSVSIDDANQFDFMLVWKLLEKATDVAMLQANNGDTQRLLCLNTRTPK